MAIGGTPYLTDRLIHFTAGTSAHPVMLTADYSLSRIRQLRAPPPDCGCPKPDIQDHKAHPQLTANDG